MKLDTHRQTRASRSGIQLWGPQCTGGWPTNFSATDEWCGWVIADRTNFPGPFFRGGAISTAFFFTVGAATSQENARVCQKPVLDLSSLRVKVRQNFALMQAACVVYYLVFHTSVTCFGPIPKTIRVQVAMSSYDIGNSAAIRGFHVFFWGGGAPNSGHSFLNLTHHRTCRQRVVESSVRRSTVEITTKKYEQNIKVGHACALAAIILCLWECLSWRSHWGSSPSSPNERRTTASVCRPSDRIKRLGPLVHQYAACYRLHPYAAWKLIVVLLAHRW